MAAVVLLIVVWFLTRPIVPNPIRIAAGKPGGLYDEFARALKGPLSLEEKYGVELLPTDGAVDNQELLWQGEADLAILQGGAVSMEGLAGVVPLYHEVVHVIARKGRGIESVKDLIGKNIIIGPKNSGMRRAAQSLFEHYGLQTDCPPAYFTELSVDATWDGAIVTTGLMNKDLRKLLHTGLFELIPIESHRALALRYPHFSSYTIPKGFFGEGPVIPPKDIHTIATMAFLAVHAEADAPLVTHTLDTLYNNDLTQTVPTLLSRSEAAQWRIFPMHPTSQGYFSPYKGLDVVANIVDALAGAKELLFALGAGLYLLWKRREYLQEQQKKEETDRQKDRLDNFLKRTLTVEEKQMDEKDPERLNQFLDDVTRIKLDALRILSTHQLRGDRTFLIFLTQCANLSRKIQSKIALYSTQQKEASEADQKKG
jgi:TRAP transporter TAXI family solute receptor